MQRLGDDAHAVREFLGEDYARLEALRARPPQGRGARPHGRGHRGRAQATRQQFLQEVKAWSGAYQVPSFTRDQKTLVKLKAFLNAKLP